MSDDVPAGVSPTSNNPACYEVSIAGKVYLTDLGVGRELRRHPRTISRWVDAGIAPPHIKLAGLPRLYDPDRIPDWLAEFEVKPVRAGRGRRRAA